MIKREFSKISWVMLCFMLVLNISSINIDVFAESVEKQIVASDFENGEKAGFDCYGGTLEVTDEVSHSGEKSLKMSNRVESWHRPTFDLTGKVSEGDIIYFKTWVYFESQESNTLEDIEILEDIELEESQTNIEVLKEEKIEKKFNLTANFTINGEEDWKQLEGAAEITVVSGEWTEIDGTYVVPSGDLDKFNVYIEIFDEDKSDFYVDDFVISKKSDDNNEIVQNYEFKFDFEDNTKDEWTENGNGKAEASDEFAHNSQYSLKYSGRVDNWNSPTYNLLPTGKSGDELTFEGWVFYNEGPDTIFFNASVNYAIDDTQDWKQFDGANQISVNKGEWTKLEGTYIVPTGNINKLNIYVENTEIVDFYLDDIVITGSRTKAPALEIERDIPSIYETYEEYFPIGAAIEPDKIDSYPHRELLLKHFNSIVAENCMKMESIQPKEGIFDFEKADKLADFAVENNLKMRGHTLVWHSQAGDWIFKRVDGSDMVPGNENDRNLLIERMENHITTVLTHFKDKYGNKNPISTWDVVNEVFDEDGTLRDSEWLQIIGPEYIEMAFNFAKKADPSIKLVINDYNLESPGKLEGMYELVKSLKEKNIPVDGVGYQAHIKLNSPSAETIRNIIRKVASLDVEFEITELDMAGAMSNDLLPKQALRYKEIFDMLKQEKDSGRIMGVTLWGLADDHTWLSMPEYGGGPAEMPLLFDKKLKAKDAYWAVVDSSKLPVYINNVTASKGNEKDIANNTLKWEYVNSFDINNSVKGDSETTATAKLIWGNNNLFVNINVNDRTLMDNDSVEIFIDQNNSKNNEREEDDKYITINRNDDVEAEGVTAKVVKTSNGYNVCANILLDRELDLNDKVGFDIRVNDYVDESDIVNVIVWNDITNSQDIDTSKYGIVTMNTEDMFVEAIKGTPQIDGEIDKVWEKAKIISTDVWVLGTEGSTAKVRTMWDENYLYILAHVTEESYDVSSKNDYEQDSVEIFVDQLHNKSTSYGEGDGQYRINYENKTSFNGIIDKNNFQSKTKIIDGGYVVEAAIALDKVKPEVGKIIGFDFQVNNGVEGSRQSVSMWCDSTSDSWQNTSAWGNLKMIELEESEEEKVNPEDEYIKPEENIDSGKLPNTGSLLNIYSMITACALLVIGSALLIIDKKAK